MSYGLILVRVPPGASEAVIEKAALAVSEGENTRPPAPPDPEAERRKRALAEALLAAYPELEGGQLDHAAIARSERITEEEARQRYNWWEVVGPEDGAGIQIAIYDDWVSIDMPWSGVDGDLEELWRYLEVLVREGGFAVFDPTGPNVVDVAAGPSGDGDAGRPSRRRRKRAPGKRESTEARVRHEDAPPDDETPRVSQIGRLIDRIVAEAIGERLASAGFRQSGRTWRRHREDGAIQVVNVQGPRRNEGDEARFFLNLGVYLPALARRSPHFPVTDTPKEYDCHLRSRPRLAGGSWAVRLPDSDPEAEKPGLLGALSSWRRRRAIRRVLAQHERATRELREALEGDGLPWLDRVSTLSGARDELVKRGPMASAIDASLELGDRDGAVRILEQALANADPTRAEELRRWARERGLIP